MKVKNAIKKVGAAAASTVMVGMTLGSAATLADFPGMFLDDQGNPTAQVVVGEEAATADVVGAVNVAAALGQGTIQTSEQSVSVSSGAAGWSADDGVTLDTANDDLFFGSAINDIRSTLTQSDMDLLEETTFRDDGGETYEITNFLNVDNQNVTFGTTTGMDSDEDPRLHLTLPAENGVDNTDYLFSLQANMEEINFTDADVQGEDLELFGRTYQVSSNDNAQGETEIVLFGSAQELELSTGESSTFTVNGDEHTLEVVSVQDSSTAAIRIDGNLRQEDLDATFNVDGQDVRLDEIVNTGSADDGQGVVVFAVGSEELKLADGNPVQDDEDDDIEGTYVEINGGSWTQVGNGVSSIEIFVGSDDDDMDWLEAGDMFSHDLFENVEVHFGGLNPDAAEEDVSEIAFSNDGDDTATIQFEDDGGNSATVGFYHDTDTSTGTHDGNLADADNDAIVVMEGQEVAGEDEYFMSDAGDFAHMWEVTSIDRDTDDNTGDLEANDEAEIDLRDVWTGSTVTVDIDAESAADGNTGNLDYVGDEIIDGQTYHFALDGDSTGDGALSGGFVVAWGDGANAFGEGAGSGPSVNVGDHRSVFPALDTESGGAVAFAENVTFTSNATTGLVMPSTESTGDQVIANGDLPSAGNSATLDAGQVSYIVNNSAGTYELGVVNAEAASALAFESEDDQDEEHAYIVTPGTDTGSDEEVGVGDVGSIDFTGDASAAGQFAGGLGNGGAEVVQENLESDDDLYVGFDTYGTYHVQNTDDQGDFTLNVPNGQAVAGVAVTGQDGALNAGGGAGGEVTYEGVTNPDIRGNLPDVAMLDSEVTNSVRQNSGLILVGGPAVNSLVADLAADGDTWTQQQWGDHQDEALLQVVNNAFSQGNHAMIVAGYAAADTRAAARYVSNYAAHQDQFEDSEQVVLSSSEYPSQ